MGARYERFWSEADEAGVWSVDQHVTALVGYRFRRLFRIQLEAVLRRSDKPTLPDLDDDLYLLAFHAEI